jgi:hypothetical protein
LGSISGGSRAEDTTGGCRGRSRPLPPLPAASGNNGGGCGGGSNSGSKSVRFNIPRLGEVGCSGSETSDQGYESDQSKVRQANNRILFQCEIIWFVCIKRSAVMWKLRCNYICSYGTLIKKKIKFSPYIGKFRVEQLQSHIYMTKGLLIYGEIFKGLVAVCHSFCLFFIFYNIHTVQSSNHIHTILSPRPLSIS